MAEKKDKGNDKDYEDAPDEEQVKRGKTRGDPVVHLEY
jgi:hypothetical protein